MDYLKNHCWCSDSNWGGHYDCQIIVGLSSYKEGYKEDWERLLTKADYFNEDTYKILLSKGLPDCEEVKMAATTKYNQLKPEVIQWLEDNVPERNGVKGWAIGSADHVRSGSNINYDIFFQQTRDAMKFIKTWSKWKKPIHYCQYFTDVRKTLDLQTLKYTSKGDY